MMGDKADHSNFVMRFSGPQNQSFVKCYCGWETVVELAVDMADKATRLFLEHQRAALGSAAVSG